MMHPSVLRLTGAILADPAAGVYAPGDLQTEDGHITGLYPAGSLRGRGEGREIDLSGCVLAPGLTDIHVHLREPGGEEHERIADGLRAAAAGGFTTVCAMPNSGVKADTPEVLRYLREEAAKSALAELLPIAAITQGLAGRTLTDMAALKSAGAIAFSDDGMPVTDSALMEEALVRAGQLGLAVIDHCEDPGLKKGGLIHEGEISRRLGLAGISAVSEAVPIARNILLAQKTGARMHIAHISTREGVSLLEYARQQGAPVTAEAMPHHFCLTDREILEQGAQAKVSPPLRGEEHRAAVAAAVKSGLISCIASDHAPWSAAAKAKPFAEAPSGISGLETSLAVAWDSFVVKDGMPPLALLARFIIGPARVLGRRPPALAPGEPANLTAIDPGLQKTVRPELFYSQGKNTPFAGMAPQGWPVLTVYQGRVVMEKGCVVSGV